MYLEFFGNISVSNLLKPQLMMSGPHLVHKIEKHYVLVCVVVEFCVFNISKNYALIFDEELCLNFVFCVWL